MRYDAAALVAAYLDRESVTALANLQRLKKTAQLHQVNAEPHDAQQRTVFAINGRGAVHAGNIVGALDAEDGIRLRPGLPPICLGGAIPGLHSRIIFLAVRAEEEAPALGLVGPVIAQFQLARARITQELAHGQLAGVAFHIEPFAGLLDAEGDARQARLYLHHL